VSALEQRGITALFPIQKVVFEPAMRGADLIARAKTGSGKTLAFAIPVIEKILAGPRLRKPQCLVLAPTRELAKQVEREIAATAPSLAMGCYYGGNPIGPQLKELRRGVDIVVGTPGRIIDLIDQDALDLSSVRSPCLPLSPCVHRPLLLRPGGPGRPGAGPDGCREAPPPCFPLLPFHSAKKEADVNKRDVLPDDLRCMHLSTG
jgi:hypothetical protein